MTVYLVLKVTKIGERNGSDVFRTVINLKCGLTGALTTFTEELFILRHATTEYRLFHTACAMTALFVHFLTKTSNPTQRSHLTKPRFSSISYCNTGTQLPSILRRPSEKAEGAKEQCVLPIFQMTAGVEGFRR